MSRYEYANARLTDMRRIEYAMRALFTAVMPLMAKMMPKPIGMPRWRSLNQWTCVARSQVGSRRGLDLRHDEEHREEEVVEDDERSPTPTTARAWGCAADARRSGDAERTRGRVPGTSAA